MAKQTVFPSAGFSAIVGACMEMIQMIFIFFFSGDLSDGATLVRFIALPMILLNSVERSFYVDSNDDIETRRAGQSGSDARCFELAAETLPYFREGLNKIPAKSCGDY